MGKHQTFPLPAATSWPLLRTMYVTLTQQNGPCVDGIHSAKLLSLCSNVAVLVGNSTSGSTCKVLGPVFQRSCCSPLQQGGLPADLLLPGLAPCKRCSLKLSMLQGKAAPCCAG